MFSNYKPSMLAFYLQYLTFLLCNYPSVRINPERDLLPISHPKDLKLIKMFYILI